MDITSALQRYAELTCDGTRSLAWLRENADPYMYRRIVSLAVLISEAWADGTYPVKGRMPGILRHAIDVAAYA